MDFGFISVIFMTVIAPLWIIFHYTSKRHNDRKLTPDDERMLEDLWRSAKAMERRLQALESITDLDEPKAAPHARPVRPAETVM